MASSVHGIVRSTGDVDIVVDLLPHHVGPFVEAVKEDFYVAEAQVTTAVAAGKSFNLIALDPIFKIDVFVAKDKAFEISQLRSLPGVTGLGRLGKNAQCFVPGGRRSSEIAVVPQRW